MNVGLENTEYNILRATGPVVALGLSRSLLGPYQVQGCESLGFVEETAC